MALIRPGPTIAAASGSVGGTTFSRNRYGMYIRNRSTPVNPGSERQVIVRSILQDLVERWSGSLTQVMRDAWNQYGAAVQMLNVLGEPMYLSGFNHFIRSNAAILRVGGTVVEDGPTTLTLPGSDPTFAVEADEANQELAVTFDNTKAWASETGGYLSVSMSPPKGEGVIFIGRYYRYADKVAGLTTSPPTSPATMAVPFSVALGQNIACQARIIRADGRVSAPFWHKSSVIS